MEKSFCQSCGMPLAEGVHGNNADGSTSGDYCMYCYKDGEFTSDVTMDEMIDSCLLYLDEFNKDTDIPLTKEQAKAQMKEYFPQLKRWHV